MEILASTRSWQARDLGRHEILEGSNKLKLFGMRANFDEIVGKGLARREELYPPVASLICAASGWPLFRLISKLYENTSLLITAPLASADWPQMFADWRQVLGDGTITAAMLNRFTHTCVIVETGNTDWRFKNRSLRPDELAPIAAPPTIRPPQGLGVFRAPCSCKLRAANTPHPYTDNCTPTPNALHLARGLAIGNEMASPLQAI
jgi:hypothetical protein